MRGGGQVRLCLRTEKFIHTYNRVGPSDFDIFLKIAMLRVLLDWKKRYKTV